MIERSQLGQNENQRTKSLCKLRNKLEVWHLNTKTENKLRKGRKICQTV